MVEIALKPIWKSLITEQMVYIRLQAIILI